MALKIVTGGTTGAADGTLVSSGNKIAFTSLDGVVDAHVRCDDDTYSTDTAFSVPSDGSIQMSYDGGSTWKAFADSPIALVTGIGLGSTDLGDLNFPIKLRQHALASSSSGTFSTDATFTSATALGGVTGFTVTPGNLQNAISWSAVTNRTSYQVDRATNSGFTTGVTLGVYTSTSTSFTDTGLTNGTTYYYRIKAIGTYRFKDSANYATGNGTPTSIIYADDFTGTAGTVLSSHTPSGTNAHGTWTYIYPAGSSSTLNMKLTSAGRVRLDYTFGGTPTTCEYEHSDTWTDGSVEVDFYGASVNNGYVLLRARFQPTGALPGSATGDYYAYLDQASGNVILGKHTGVISTVASGLGTNVTGTHNLKLECIGTAIKVYIDGVQKISATDSAVTGAGTSRLQLNQGDSTAFSDSAGVQADNFKVTKIA